MIRLFVEGELAAGGSITPTAQQAHYLTGVMRLGPGEAVVLFNGRDGEWTARVADVSKRGCRLGVEALLRVQAPGPDLDLIIALVKRSRLEIIVEKAAELGARRVRLVLTDRTTRDIPMSSGSRRSPWRPRSRRAGWMRRWLSRRKSSAERWRPGRVIGA